MGQRARARSTRYLLWKGIVFEQLGPLADSGLPTEEQPTDLVATETLSSAGKLIEEGEPITLPPPFGAHNQPVEIRVKCWDGSLGATQLLERGLARPAEAAA